MKCTVCGGPVQRGERFCPACGTALNTPPTRERVDQGRNQQYSVPREKPVYVPAPAAEEWEPEPVPVKRDRGLNIALLICAVLAIAVVTFVVILLFFSDKQSPAPVLITPAPTQPVPVVSGGDASGAPPAASSAPGGETVVITLPPTAPTTAPTTAPVVVPTTAPTPGQDSSSEYLLPDSNTRYLTEADLSGLTHEQLCFARNEIFARHGRIFQTPEIAAYFNSKSWYKGTISAENFKDSVFNEYERANINFIAEYEKKHYGGSYY